MGQALKGVALGGVASDPLTSWYGKHTAMTPSLTSDA